jgi:hypothetical protein
VYANHCQQQVIRLEAIQDAKNGPFHPPHGPQDWFRVQMGTMAGVSGFLDVWCGPDKIPALKLHWIDGKSAQMLCM